MFENNQIRSISAPAEFWQRVDELAKAYNMDRSGFVRLCIKRCLEDHPDGPPLLPPDTGSWDAKAALDATPKIDLKNLKEITLGKT